MEANYGSYIQTCYRPSLHKVKYYIGHIQQSPGILRPFQHCLYHIVVCWILRKLLAEYLMLIYQGCSPHTGGIMGYENAEAKMVFVSRMIVTELIWPCHVHCEAREADKNANELRHTNHT